MFLFGARLRRVRRANNMTQQRLGDLVGVTKASISCYESETRTPTLSTLVDLADALNVEVLYLLGADTYMVASDDVKYGVNISRDEIRMIRIFRRYPYLYKMMLQNPRSVAERISKILR